MSESFLDDLLREAHRPRRDPWWVTGGYVVSGVFIGVGAYAVLFGNPLIGIALIGVGVWAACSFWAAA